MQGGGTDFARMAAGASHRVSVMTGEPQTWVPSSALIRRNGISNLGGNG
jgi:hypothetical protein